MEQQDPKNSQERIEAARLQLRSLSVVHYGDPTLPDGVGTRDPYYSKNGTEAFVDDGSLIGTGADASAQKKADICNSLLLAQRAATKQFDRVEKPTEWYGKFHEVLAAVGWSVGAFAFGKYTPTGVSFSFCDDVLPQAIGAFPLGAKDLIQTSVAAINTVSDDDERLILFETISHSSHEGNMQVGAAILQNSIVRLCICEFHYSTTQDISRSLKFSFHASDTSVFFASQVLDLNETVYNSVRATVLGKLLKLPLRRIKNLEI